MSSEDSTDVTLALVDPALVSCWDRLVKQGKECFLLLKHSKGKVVATLHNGASNEIKEIKVFKKCPKVEPYCMPIFDPNRFEPF